jgi:hypothetical protein
MHRSTSLVRRRAIALLGVLVLGLGSSGCVLWAFHERNKALDRQKKQNAEHQANFEKCKAEVAARTRVPDAPPAAPIDGTWQCLYTSPTGEQFAESVTFTSSGRDVSVTGRDNWNNNIIADGHLGGREMMYTPAENSVVNMTLHPSGRTLDGQAMYWYADGLTCHDTKYRCRRRY